MFAPMQVSGSRWRRTTPIRGSDRCQGLKKKKLIRAVLTVSMIPRTILVLCSGICSVLLVSVLYFYSRWPARQHDMQDISPPVSRKRIVEGKVEGVRVGVRWWEETARKKVSTGGNLPE